MIKLNRGVLQECISIKNLHTSDTTFVPELIDNYQFSRVKFKGICLKQDSVSFLHKTVINLHVSDTLNPWSKDLKTGFTVGNSIFRAVELPKNDDPDKYKYSRYSIGFDLGSQFSWTDRSEGKISLFLELIIVLLCILMVKKKNLSSW